MWKKANITQNKYVEEIMISLPYASSLIYMYEHPSTLQKIKTLQINMFLSHSKSFTTNTIYDKNITEIVKTYM